ncbi:MAG: cobalt-precorrin-5B (C(1))-methyltransferase CbiD [Oscillospiraceae bacterium]
MINEYKTVDGKKLRLGYTTGSCGAAAAKAAAIMLMTGNKLESVCLMTPKGIDLTLELHHIQLGLSACSCGVKKDGGDDPDVTNGMLVYANVEKITANTIVIDGGDGVGRVTKPGLNQPVGNAAINSVPRKMLTEELLRVKDDYNYSGGFKVTISAENGEEIAKKTFNSRLGIIGGISILGTSGIVEPMSDEAIVNTIKAEINVHKAQGDEYLLVTPGNYGKDYIAQSYDFTEQQSIKCSNFIGITLEYAAEMDFKGVLLIGHAGKLVKLAGGLFNTHSRYGDCRGEIIAANTALCGGKNETLKEILNSATVDEMLVWLEKSGLKQAVLSKIIDKIYNLTNARVYGKIQVETVVYTQKLGLIAQTNGAQNMAQKIKEQQ